MSTTKPRSLSVAVVGAGAAGLVTVRELLREGHTVTAFEQNNNVGGIWDYQEECETEDLLGRDPNRRHVHSSMYSSLRTNLPRQIMSFSDFPFIPEVMGDRTHDPRRFPKHTEVQAWLEVFAAKFDLRKHVRFNTQVITVQPLPPATSDSSPAPDSDAPASVTSAPRWKLTVQPSLASEAFAKEGSQDPSDIEESNGSANAAELNDVSLVHGAQQARHSASNGGAHADVSTSNSNRHQNGGAANRATQQAHAASNSLSTTAKHNGFHQPDGQAQLQTHTPHQQQAQSLVAVDSAEQSHYEFDAVVVCVGNYHQPNLPEVKGMDDFPGLQMHAHNYRSADMFAEQRVIIVGASFSGEELARAVADVATHVYHSARSFDKSTARNNISRVAMLTELARDGTATLKDGTQIQHIDAIIYCTGYQYAYPFLEGTGVVTSHDRRVDPLWQHIFPPSVAPTLSFVGLAWKSIRNMQFELQAKVVGRGLSGRVVLPSKADMMQDIADFYQLLIDCGLPVSYTHNQTEAMPVNQWVYNAKLVQLCGPDVAAQPDWLRTLYSSTSANILGSPDTFRDVWGPDELAAYELGDSFCQQMLQKAA